MYNGSQELIYINGRRRKVQSTCSISNGNQSYVVVIVKARVVMYNMYER